VESRRWDVSVSERDTRNFLSAAIGRRNVLPGPSVSPPPRFGKSRISRVGRNSAVTLLTLLGIERLRQRLRLRAYARSQLPIVLARLRRREIRPVALITAS